jgi:hypothetical protein
VTKDEVLAMIIAGKGTGRRGYLIGVSHSGQFSCID